MNNTALGILIGITITLTLLLIVFPLVMMTGMGGMMGFGGMGGMMGLRGSMTWLVWPMLTSGLIIVGGFILLIVWGKRRAR